MKISRRCWLKWATGLSLSLIHNSVWGTCLSEKTLEQALGPFYPNSENPVFPIRENKDPNLMWIESNDNDLTLVKGLKEMAEGQIIYLKGHCLDSKCQPISGAKILLWQACASGRYNHLNDNTSIRFRDPRNGTLIERKHDPNFQYWGHTVTNEDGSYWFKTVIPGFYPADLSTKWFRPPHLHFIIQAKGYTRLTTQTYFGGTNIWNPDWVQYLNSRDHVLKSKGSLQEQKRLIVEYEPDSKKNELVGTFDFHLEKLNKIRSFFNLY